MVEPSIRDLSGNLLRHFEAISRLEKPMYLDSIYELSFFRCFSPGELGRAMQFLEQTEKVKIKRTWWRTEVQFLAS